VALVHVATSGVLARWRFCFILFSSSDTFPAALWMSAVRWQHTGLLHQQQGGTPGSGCSLSLSSDDSYGTGD